MLCARSGLRKTAVGGLARKGNVRVLVMKIPTEFICCVGIHLCCKHNKIPEVTKSLEQIHYLFLGIKWNRIVAGLLPTVKICRSEEL